MCSGNQSFPRVLNEKSELSEYEIVSISLLSRSQSSLFHKAVSKKEARKKKWEEYELPAEEANTKTDLKQGWTRVFNRFIAQLSL